MGSLYTFGIALFAAIGTFLFVSYLRNRRYPPLRTDASRALTPVSQRQVCSSISPLIQETLTSTLAIAHQSWIDYMNHPSKGLTGAVVSVYIAGEACGAILQTCIGDQLGRIRFMQLMCIIVTIGTTIQTASISIGMFLAGRALAGFAVGALVATVPIYLSEISAPHQRGLIGGISGCGISLGTMMSNVSHREIHLEIDCQT